MVKIMRMAIVAFAVTALPYTANAQLGGNQPYHINYQEEKPGYRIAETLEYCYKNNLIAATDTTETEKCRGVHEYIIKPFFEDFARSQGKSPAAVNTAEYCNIHRHIVLSNSYLANTMAQDSSSMTIAILSFGKCNQDLSECLNTLQDKDFTPIKVISEAPVQCLAHWDGKRLFVVWHNLLEDSERIVHLVRSEFLR